jgi:hypothetical protein
MGIVGELTGSLAEGSRDEPFLRFPFLSCTWIASYARYSCREILGKACFPGNTPDDKERRNV